MERPEFISEEIFQTLSNLDQKDVDNLFLIIPRLIELYPDLSAYEAQQILLSWQNEARETSA